MKTKKLYEIIGDNQVGHFYSDEYGYINGNCDISIRAIISRKVKTKIIVLVLLRKKKKEAQR